MKSQFIFCSSSIPLVVAAPSLSITLRAQNVFIDSKPKNQ